MLRLRCVRRLLLMSAKARKPQPATSRLHAFSLQGTHRERGRSCMFLSATSREQLPSASVFSSCGCQGRGDRGTPGTVHVLGARQDPSLSNFPPYSVHSLPMAAVANGHKLSVLKTHLCYLTVLEVRGSLGWKSRCQQGCVPSGENLFPCLLQLLEAAHVP